MTASLLKVTKPYTAQYRDPIQLERGDTVQVAHSDPQYPEWFWCCGPSGKQGWVHSFFLASTCGTTSALEKYTARELTVTGGESGTLIRLLGGWAHVRLDNGDEGWIPQSHLEFVREARRN
jgi:SH3-like domain-containing protein